MSKSITIDGIEYVPKGSEKNAHETEEWGGWKIVSDMLDKPDAIGIYSTSECYQKLYEFVCQQKEKAVEDYKAELREKIDDIVIVLLIIGIIGLAVYWV